MPPSVRYEGFSEPMVLFLSNWDERLLTGYTLMLGGGMIIAKACLNRVVNGRRYCRRYQRPLRSLEQPEAAGLKP